MKEDLAFRILHVLRDAVALVDDLLLTLESAVLRAHQRKMEYLRDVLSEDEHSERA